jgi:hypothetical protein
MGLMSGVLVTGFGSVANAALPVTGTAFSTTVPDPVGVTATPSALYVSTWGAAGVPNCNTIWSLDTSGNPTAIADLSVAPLSAPCESDEVYMAVAPGPFGIYPGGELFAADGPNVYVMPAGGCGGATSGCVSLFANLPTLPENIGSPPDAMGGSHTGLTFATSGPLAGDLIAVGENASAGGDVYVITPGGTATLVLSIPSSCAPAPCAAAFEGLEAPSILPTQWGTQAGDIITVSDQSSALFIIKSDGTPGGTSFTTDTDTTNLLGAEATAVVQPSPCNYGGSSYFASMFNASPNATIEGYAPTTLTSNNLVGDVLVNTEGNTSDAPPYLGVLVLSPNGTSSPTVNTFDDSVGGAQFQQEGGSMATCPVNTTSLTTNLSATGVTTNPTITVPTGTAVTDTATLTGASANAGGTVQYTVYTDANCTVFANVGTGAMLGNAGTANVSAGVPGSSNAVTLTASGPGTTLYYWQASYSGDQATGDAPSTSTCGLEVATVNPPQQTGGETFTPGYYKNNHGNITCATLLTFTPVLGTYPVPNCTTAIQILQETACGGQDGLVKCVAEQLLVAELQRHKGAAYGGPSNSCIDTEIMTVINLLKNDVGPSGYAGPVGPYTITNNATALFQAAQVTLSNYNQDANPSHC